MSPPVLSRSPSPKRSSVKSPSDNPGPDTTLAAYIADMAAELARLAGEADMPMLCYFLNLARVEADFHVKGVPIPRDRT